MERLWICGDPKAWGALEELRHEAERTGQYLVARRAHAVQLHWEGWGTTQIAEILHVYRVSVIRWLHHWQDFGLEGLLEGQHSDRPPLLSEEQRQMLADLIESGPIAYGFLSGVWTSPMVVHVIEAEFGTVYHPGHVRKLLYELGFSVQRPRRTLLRADPAQQQHWTRWIYPSLKREARAEGAAMLFTDEATFRVDPTLHQTWARVGQ